MKKRLGKIFAGKNRVEFEERLACFDPEFKEIEKLGSVTVISTASDR